MIQTSVLLSQNNLLVLVLKLRTTKPSLLLRMVSAMTPSAIELIKASNSAQSLLVKN